MFFAEKFDMTRYNQTTEELMRIHFAGLSEPQRRQYTYLEVSKLGHGGKNYMSKL
jgi:hypothetical protein